jgi:UDP-GlcNAc:undecaprenyl-phosphate GlcNAc-1-phosphate transferase
MFLLLLFVFCVLVSIVFIRLSISAANAVNISDAPGTPDTPDSNHKLHDTDTPFVGGVGVLAALCVAIFFLVDVHSETFHKYGALGIISITIFAIGFADDVIKLHYKSRFVIQILVVFVMVLLGGVALSDFGGILFSPSLQMGAAVIPITIFAVIGVINALNMIDGVDGLSGSVSLITLLLIGTVVFIGDDGENLMLTTVLIGGVLGFLYFNLRYGKQRYARVFLGDNGSMLLGLLLAWLLVDISQGSNRVMTPVTALWLFSVPLMDTVIVMLRRAWLGKSPFTSDRNHLHHLMQRAGLRVPEIVFIIVLVHTLLGIIGLMGLYLGISETTMFICFLLSFLGYIFLTIRPWRFVPLLRQLHILLNTRLGFSPIASDDIFTGSYSAKQIESIAKVVSETLGISLNYGLRVYEQLLKRNDCGKRFSIMLSIWPDKKECVSAERLKQYISLLQHQLKMQQNIQLRQFTARDYDAPEAYRSGNAFGESKTANRRRLGPQALVFEATYCEE